MNDRLPERHDLDAFALTVGLLGVAVGLLAFAAQGRWFHVDGVVVLATAWIVVGAVGLSRAVHRLTGHD